MIAKTWMKILVYINGTQDKQPSKPTFLNKERNVVARAGTEKKSSR